MITPMKPMMLAAAAFAVAALTTTAAQTKKTAAAAATKRPFTVVEATIPDMQAAMKAGRVTSRELVQQSLTRIAYYEDRLNDGGTVIAVHADRSEGSLEDAREILFRNGGHSASRARTDAV